MGEGLRRAKMAAEGTRNDGREAYLVVCFDGDITGKFGQPLQGVKDVADAMNRGSGCGCGGPHQIIRMVQTGSGQLCQKK